MPPFNNTGDETETKKRSASEIAAGITNVLLILIIAFFTCASLWLGVFAIPSFFAFFRASVVAISSVREGINQLQGSIHATHPLAFRSLRFGAASGLVITFIAGGLTIFSLELIRYWFLDDTDDALSIFNGVFRIIGAVVFTHLGVSVLQQGSRMVRSASFYQERIHDIRTRPETAGGPDRSQMFHLGLGASLREGVISYIYMIPLGGAYEAKYLPLPAVLGAIAGALAARYIAPALLWGGIVGESEGILPDSNAKSWAKRREMLTNQYVANLAAKAQGQASFGESVAGNVKQPGDALYASVASDADVDNDGVAKNLSQLSAGALQEMFQDSNVDPAAFDAMDYAQKRLLLLKSSKVAFAPSTNGGEESDEEDDEPAILTMQNSAQWPSVRSMGDGVSEEKLPERRPPLIPNPNGVGSRAIFHRKGQSLVSISEDADGHFNRGGYSDDGSGLGLIARGRSGGSEASHARSGSNGSAHHARMASNDTPLTQHHQRMRSAMKQGGGSGMTGRSRDQSMVSSVRFENDDDDARSVMDGFQHRHLAQVGARDPSLELEVMEETLSQYSRNRGNGRTISFMPGSPQHTAPGAPISSEDLDESVGGNLALGSSRTSSRRSNGGLLSFMKSSRRVGDSFKIRADGKEDGEEEEEDEEMGSAGFNGRNAIPNDVADKSFFATIALALSAFVVFGCCAGLLKLGVLDFKGLFSDSEIEVFNICEFSSTCCSPDEQGSIAEMFFAIFNSQFGYTCSETLIGIIAWAAYWLYPVIVCMYATRMCCFSSIPLKEQPQMPVMPERRAAGAYAAAVYSARSTKRFLGGAVPDPARIKMHSTHFWIKLSALLNVVAGAAYIWWRAARSMPDDPASPIWNWLFFSGECILMVGVWTSHLQRAFPAVRDVCNMDDLCEIDPGVSKEAMVCIMVPTAGEKMKNLKHVLLGAYSQRLWQTAAPTSHQLRVAVLDEKGRHEVRDLVEKVYKLAKSLINPAVQLELSTKFNEPYVTPKIFMDYFNQMDALDKFVFGPVCHPTFDFAVKLENYAGPKAGKLVRASSSAAVNVKGKKTKAAGTRLEEGFKELFNTSPNIPSMIYSARANPGTPKVSPKAGNMNASIFPNSPGEEPVIGDSARIVVVNDARHRLKTEFLQRTVPYFFKLNRRTGKHYEWADVGYVQTPQRFEDLGDGDPLGNHAVLTFFVSNVSKDGVGGVTSCGQGSLWRVDALRGMAADGRQTADHVKNPDIIGHDCGFRSEVLIEDTHTSLEFFKLQWRSAYVCEPGETLAVCVEQPNTVAWRVKQVFRWHIGAVQLLLKDGVAFLCTSRMPTPLHKMFGLDSLTYYIQAVGGLFIILMPIMFSIFQETPFDTLDLEFVYFFFPYILTATIPTLLSVGWKNVNPNRVLTDEQFWLSTCYVQVWALVLGLWNRITCANPDNAWNLKCPVWPLGLIFCLLGVSAINTTVYWMFYLMFDISGIWIFLASFGACIIVMYSIWPMVKLWWPGAIGLPSKYHAKFVLVLLFIALSSVLVVYIDIDT